MEHSYSELVEAPQQQQHKQCSSVLETHRRLMRAMVSACRGICAGGLDETVCAVASARSFTGTSVLEYHGQYTNPTMPSLLKASSRFMSQVV